MLVAADMASEISEEVHGAALPRRAEHLHGEFAALLTAGLVNVLPLTADELEAAVLAPARRVGVDVEPRCWPSLSPTRRTSSGRSRCCSTR